MNTTHGRNVVDGTDLSGIPVELDGAVRSEVGFQQGPVCFQDGYSSTAIVIGTFLVIN